jgi:hypothetical protein
MSTNYRYGTSTSGGVGGVIPPLPPPRKDGRNLRECYICRKPCIGKRCKDCYHERSTRGKYTTRYDIPTTSEASQYTTQRICRGGTTGGGGTDRKIPKNRGDDVK